MTYSEKNLIPWNELSAEQQREFQVEYGYFLDTLPPTCSMQTKIERFKNWLEAEKNVTYGE